MQDYKKMYFDLFNEVTKAVEVLQKAQQNAEEQYIQMKKPTKGQAKRPKNKKP